MRTLLKLAMASVALVAMQGTALAKPKPPVVVVIPSCTNTDINPTALACAGYGDKNLLGGSPGMVSAAQTLLNSIGFTGDASLQIEHIVLTSPSVNFVKLLNGTTFVGIHWGAGEGPFNTPGGVTGFYRFEAGTNLDQFTTNWGSNSGAVLYGTGNPMGGVPEPGTWALMMLGVGAIGAGMRRKSAKPAFAA